MSVDSDRIKKCINEYISGLNNVYKTGSATEPSYRGAIQKLIESLGKEKLDTNISAINEPSSKDKKTRPDILVKNGEHYIGFIETKDINKNLNDKKYEKQFTKYKNAFPNLIITDYLYFILYINGEEKGNVRIGEVVRGKIQITEENINKFDSLLETFISYNYNTPIDSVEMLVKEMAGKTLILKEELVDKKDELKDDFDFIEKHLVCNQREEGLIDGYAQILMFGFLIKKLNGGEIPKSNGFLRGMFNVITEKLKDELKCGYIIDIINNLFDSFDVEIFYKKYKDNDDVLIYFYEEFLKHYNNEARKQLGAWYTPKPIVDFMVRNTSDLIKSEFKITDGLADATDGEGGGDTNPRSGNRNWNLHC